MPLNHTIQASSDIQAFVNSSFLKDIFLLTAAILLVGLSVLGAGSFCTTTRTSHNPASTHLIKGI